MNKEKISLFFHYQQSIMSFTKITCKNLVTFKYPISTPRTRTHFKKGTFLSAGQTRAQSLFMSFQGERRLGVRLRRGRGVTPCAPQPNPHVNSDWVRVCQRAFPKKRAFPENNHIHTPFNNSLRNADVFPVVASLHPKTGHTYAFRRLI